MKEIILKKEDLERVNGGYAEANDAALRRIEELERIRYLKEKVPNLFRFRSGSGTPLYGRREDVNLF